MMPDGDGMLGELEALAAGALPGESLGADRAPFGHASFIQLGGNSLLAMSLAAIASDQFGVGLPVRDLLSDTPVRTVLSRALAAGRSAHRPRPPAAEAPAAGEAPAAEASAAQRGMWIREQAFGALPYNLLYTCFIDGPLDPDLLTTSVVGAVQRHEGLRTVFLPSGPGLERRVLESYLPSLRRHEIDGPAADFSIQARALATELGRMPFDLGAAPPLRFWLASDGACQHALILAVHHILLDAWAIGLVLAEIFARYEVLADGGRPDLGPTVRFDEYLQWQRRLRQAGELDRQKLFWQRQLTGAPVVLDLPADRARPPFQVPDGARCPFRLDEGLSAAVRARAAELGITPAAFLLAAFALTLSRYTGVCDLLVGTPVAGRLTPRLAGLVALTVNVVPVRVEIDDEQPISSFLAGVQQSLAGSLDNAALPLEELVAQAGVSGTHDRHPLVQVAFGMHDGLIPSRLRAADLDVRVEEGHGGGAQFDLELFIRQSDPTFAGDLEYATSVWQAPEAAAFGADLSAAVRGLTGSPSSPLEDVRCIAPGRQAVLDTLSRPSSPYPLTSIDEEFREQARRRPDAIALREAGQSVSYGALAQAAAAQARLLADVGVTEGSTVLVGAARSLAEVVAVLGVLWAGAAYVAVEPDTPASRIRQIVSVVRPAAVIGPLPLGGSADQGGPRPVEMWPNLPGTGLPALPPDPDRAAYVAFTSGSTGVPKGVCVPHRGVLRLVAGLAEYTPVGPDDRLLRFCPLAFDVSTFELWGALLTGASLEVCPAGMPSPAELGRFIRESQVSVAWLTSGLFTLACEFALDDLAGVRYLLSGGDVVSAPHVRRLLDRHRGVTFVNGYGPTENTTFTTVYPITDPAAVEDPLPIGGPVANTQLHILDHRRRLVPPGAIGELYAAGAGLAEGYYGDQELTARSFGHLSGDVPARLYRIGDIVRLDTSGRLRFLGRRDDQVKIRGFRVELDEIRAVLATHPLVSDALVTVAGEGNAKQIIAACVPAGDGVTALELADFLAARLPDYMIPALWAILPELPLTANGKIDRRKIKDCSRPVAAFMTGD